MSHEPPLVAFLPDREVVLAACEDVRHAYERDGHGAAMARFIALVMADGELVEVYLRRPAPNPSAFGLPVGDDGTRDDPLPRNLRSCTTYEPDLERLRALGDRLVLAVGEDSGDTLAAQAARSVARALGGEAVVVVPGDHGGFMGVLHGRPAGRPAEFAAALREILG